MQGLGNRRQAVDAMFDEIKVNVLPVDVRYWRPYKKRKRNCNSKMTGRSIENSGIEWIHLDSSDQNNIEVIRAVNPEPWGSKPVF